MSVVPNQLSCLTTMKEEKRTNLRTDVNKPKIGIANNTLI